MKKIIYAIPLLSLALFFASCEPAQDDESPSATVSSEQLSQELRIEAQTEGNNNLVVYTTPTRYIYVYDAENGELIGNGTRVNVQVLPPAREVKYYVQTTGFDMKVAKSAPKSIKVTTFTDLDPILTTLFGDGKGNFTSHKYTWNNEAPDGLWGNGGYMESTGPAWWVVKATDIEEQAKKANLPKDGLKGWFTLGLGANNVKTSRGETGSVAATSEHLKGGWDIGTLTFKGTMPLMGIQPNYNNQRQYVFQILKATDQELRLCAGEPNAGDWGTAWFWNFKRVE